MLTAVDEMRQGIGLRAYGSTDPLVAYKREAHDMWDQLRENIRSNVARQIYHARIVYVEGRYNLLDTSSNGTFVNGSKQAVGRQGVHHLEAGDQIAIGGYELRVEIGAPRDEDLNAALATAPPRPDPAASIPDLGAALDLRHREKKHMILQELITQQIPGISTDEITAHFNLLPERYFIHTDSSEIALHIQMVNRLLHSITTTDWLS